MFRAAVMVSFLACCFADVLPASAQFIRGRVVHDRTGAPLANVSVQLMGPEGRALAQAVTDTAGGFYMQAARTGEYELRAERIGLAPLSSLLTVEISQQVDLVLRMAETAVALEPLTVEARKPLNIGSLAGYYERIEQSQRLGIGTVITRDWLRERRASSVSDIFQQLPGTTVSSAMYGTGQVRLRRGGGAGCIPQVYFDGILANRAGPIYVNEMPRPDDLEGIEIYRGIAEMGEFYDNTGCGVILFWTRRTGDEAPPFTWRRLISFGVVMSLIAVLIQNF